MRKTVWTSLILVLILSCNSDSEDIIPNVRFTATINLDDPEYSGRIIFIVKRDGLNPRVGVNGVAVYRFSNLEYYAFDLMCTHEHETSGYFFVEQMEKDDFTLKCPECGSEFRINNEYGSVMKGPAAWPLKKYKTSVSGNYLRIWN
ncbi:MAG: Rieske (2Fe-2S) protein [Marinilabiliaceae bacterium]|nr:Rieske (2Fe-2S) protein [Marinilabiliaceae bacterium]